MPKIKSTQGSGMTQRAVLEFDEESPPGIRVLIQAAINTQMFSSFHTLSNNLDASKNPGDEGGALIQ
jgi:hypothetical protein